MKGICISILCAFALILNTKAQQIFTKINPWSYLDGNGKPMAFYTPYGVFQNLDSSYTLMGCVYAGTHTNSYFHYIVHLETNGNFDSTLYISPSGIGGIYTCATFLLYDSSLTSGFTNERWDHDTAMIGTTLWTFHLTKDNNGTTYIQLVRDNGTVTLLDTVGQTFYTYSRYLRFAEAPLIAPLADNNLLIVYTNRNQELEVVKYNTTTYRVDYRFTATKDVLSLFDIVLKYDAHASGHICMIKTLDGGYLLATKVNRLDYDWQNSMLLMKFDSVGNFYWPFTTGEKEISSGVAHNVYPNPAQTQVNFELTERGSFQLTISDVNGKIVYVSTVNTNETITTTKWGKGVYFYTLSSTNKVAKGKLIVY